MPKAKRTSMKGMGADLYFQPPEQQQDSMTASQQDSTAAEQQSVNPSSQLASNRASSLIKLTVYVTPEHNLKLETIRLERKRKGDKVDKSGLVREAIDRLES
jgi:hypothetical protein